MQNQKQQVQTLFDESDYWQGRIYREPDHHFAQKIARRKVYAFEMIRRLPNLQLGSALDIGCGPGLYVEELITMGFDVYGMDNSPQMLKKCKEFLEKNNRATSAHLSLADIEELPFENEKFDLVLCIGVLDYLLTDEIALAEILRIMKPGGYFLLSISNQWNFSDLGYIMRRKFYSLFGRNSTSHPFESQPLNTPTATWKLKHQSAEYHLRQYNLRKFERLMREFHFQLADAMTFGFQFRTLRRLNIFPESILTSLEVFLEKNLWKFHIPYFSYSGETYTALFRKAH